MKWNFLRNSANFIGAVVISTTFSFSMEAFPTYLQAPADGQIFSDYGNHYFYCEGTPQEHKGASAIYNLAAPKAPLFHPYTIADDDLSRIDLRQVDLVPHTFCFPLFMRLPLEMATRFKQQIPHIVPDNIALDKIDCMITVQNMPWIQGRPVLYRPHYYLEPNAPYLAGYQRTPNIQASLHFWKGNPVSFSRDQMCSSTHPAGGITVLSGPADASIVLNGVDNQQSSLFFSTLQGDGRYAVTLHVLLNDIDCESFKKISQVCSSQGALCLGDFVKGPLNKLKAYFGGESIFESLYTVLTDTIKFEKIPMKQPISFNGLLYVYMYPDLLDAVSGGSSEKKNNFGIYHYENYGRGEGRYSFPLGKFYVNKNPDLYAAWVSLNNTIPIEVWGRDHYNNYGRSENRDFSFPADFNGLTYINMHKDLASITLNFADREEAEVWGLMHYINSGCREGRVYK